MHHSIDRRDGAVYVFAEGPADPLRLAVDVALTTGRPLLLRGDPGIGKSSIAGFVAKEREWRYYEHVVTARTDVDDLLWTFDAVRKLAAASGDAPIDDHDYVDPGPLWWAFDRPGAMDRGRPVGNQEPRRPLEPFAELNVGRAPGAAVVLIDEIDKADPDVPNALLVPLGSGQFRVRETDTLVEQRGTTVLVIVTTNEERDLPPAFIRRCVVHTLATPAAPRLVDIADAHAAAEQRPLTPAERTLVRAIAELTENVQKRARELRVRPPGVAEFLDTVWACLDLQVRLDGDDRWEHVKAMTLLKDPQLR